jgi:hypothetical protein
MMKEFFYNAGEKGTSMAGYRRKVNPSGRKIIFRDSWLSRIKFL